MLDNPLPFIPGDVANASTFRYPVIYRAVPGLDAEACLDGAPEFSDRVVAQARWLAAQGVRGISSDCGFMLQYQDAVRDALDVPVCLSSMLQLHFVARTLRRDQSIGVVTAHSGKLTAEFLIRHGVEVDDTVIIRGMQDEPEFCAAVIDAKGTLDSDLMTQETVRTTSQMMRDHPNIGAILLECSQLPPYAYAVQAAIGLPVFDFITMIDYLQSGTHCTPPKGFM